MLQTKHIVRPTAGSDGRYRYIYRIINNVSGRIYIGKHVVRSNLTPFTDHYCGSGVALQAGFEKYGKSNFTKEIIEYCDDDQSLNEAEKRHIAALFESNAPTYNISPGGDGANDVIVAKSIEKTRRRPIVLFEFTSKYSGKHFAKGHIFESAIEAGRQIGFQNPSTFCTNVMYNKSHSRIWVDVHNDIDWYTAFIFEDELNQYGTIDDACEYFKRQYERWRQQYIVSRQNVLAKSQAAARVNNKKRIRCLNTFTSHLNGTTFEAGHVFDSVEQASAEIGFKRSSLFSRLVIHHETHPMEMYRKAGQKSVYVASFQFVDD